MNMFKQLGLTLGLGIAAIGLTFQPVVATPISGAATGLAVPETSIDFELGALADGTIVTNQFISQGVTFGGNIEIRTIAPFANISGRHLDDAGTGIRTILFEQTIQAASFNVRTDSGSTTFQAFLGGGLVDSFSAATDLVSTSNFFGFEDILFDEIRLSGQAETGFNLDNLEFVTVAEPSAIALLGLGVIGFGALRRRKTA